jgi:hypothetical protein
MDYQTLMAILDRFEQHSAEIFVRERINGEYKNVALDELPTKTAIRHVCRMLREQVATGSDIK